METGTPSYIARERHVLELECLRQGRYFAFFNDDDYQFHVYLVCPDTGVYRFKLVKLHVKMPVNFPEDPPEVRDFDHHAWKIQFPNWKYGEVCHHMLLYLRELLDDNPFKHEPCGQDSPELSRFAQYVTWDALLLRYIANETDRDALGWLREYVRVNGTPMIIELERQRAADPGREYFTNLYHERIPADYLALGEELEETVTRAWNAGGDWNQGGRST
ncbi:hypothetical protein SLS63_002705 [Diaporthe eres]|uniref:UBC core domain-containing protein n=1 Tax=Diaporthe eres TaxID=83184 RepID=A0ABR1PIE5_DIAER